MRVSDTYEVNKTGAPKNFLSRRFIYGSKGAVFRTLILTMSPTITVASFSSSDNRMYA